MNGIDLKCLSRITTVQKVRIAGVDFQMEVYFPQIIENRKDNLYKIIDLAMNNENYNALRQMYFNFYNTYKNPGKCCAKEHEIKMLRNRCKKCAEYIEDRLLQAGEEIYVI